MSVLNKNYTGRECSKMVGVVYYWVIKIHSQGSGGKGWCERYPLASCSRIPLRGLEIKIGPGKLKMIVNMGRGRKNHAYVFFGAAKYGIMVFAS